MDDYKSYYPLNLPLGDDHRTTHLWLYVVYSCGDVADVSSLHQDERFIFRKD